jgi:hypothetical protein
MLKPRPTRIPRRAEHVCVKLKSKFKFSNLEGSKRWVGSKTPPRWATATGLIKDKAYVSLGVCFIPKGKGAQLTSAAAGQALRGWCSAVVLSRRHVENERSRPFVYEFQSKEFRSFITQLLQFTVVRMSTT